MTVDTTSHRWRVLPKLAIALLVGYALWLYFEKRSASTYDKRYVSLHHATEDHAGVSLPPHTTFVVSDVTVASFE